MWLFVTQLIEKTPVVIEADDESQNGEHCF